jgi:hypothetical protein
VPLLGRSRRAQLAMPVIGFLRSTQAAGFAYIVDAFRHGLSDVGFVEGKNVAIEYRWADNQLIGYRNWRPISCADRWSRLWGPALGRRKQSKLPPQRGAVAPLLDSVVEQRHMQSLSEGILAESQN